jgi:hypothetical protein
MALMLINPTNFYRAEGAKARGIVAEPLIYSARSGEYISDGADSPTRGARGAPLVRLRDEAARPNEIKN